jgi:hypothetical protein
LARLRHRRRRRPHLPAPSCRRRRPATAERSSAPFRAA